MLLPFVWDDGRRKNSFIVMVMGCHGHGLSSNNNLSVLDCRESLLNVDGQTIRRNRNSQIRLSVRKQAAGQTILFCLVLPSRA